LVEQKFCKLQVTGSIPVTSSKETKMTYNIKIGQKQVYSTNNLKEAFQMVKELFRKGETDIYLYGGRLGNWR
tara:strand:+ start:115 stop:330 length:216 start_codon:yes stop_codon:yes gene_type:complete